MKKLFLLAAGLALTLTACQKDEGFDPVGMDYQTITVTLPQSMQTRATADDFGDGSLVDRCLLQVYRNNQPYGEQQVATVTGKKATFTLRLVAQQTYDFVFWADCSTGDHYATEDLTDITVKGGYTGNNDAFDAFTGTLLNYEVTGAFQENITLRRPFGQLNVKTLDIASIPDAALKPTQVKVAFTAVPTSYNAYTGLVGGQTSAVEYTSNVLSENGDLTVDYIWAPVEEAALADFAITFYNGATEISTNEDFKNIPIRRNYRTNVSGNLLTKQGTFTVTIDPVFNKPDIIVAGSEEEVLAAIAAGGSVMVAAPIDMIDLSTTAPAADLNLMLNAAVGTLKLGTTQEAPKKTTITVAKDVPYPAFTVARNSNIRNLEIVGDPTSSESCTSGITANGLTVSEIDHVTIRGVRFKGEGVNFAYTANPQRVTDILVEDCVGEEMLKPFFQISRNLYDGCEMGDIVIRNNTVTFSPDANKSSVNGIYICLTTKGSVVIENNTLVNALYHGITGNENRCEKFIIRGNTITNPEQDGIKFDYPDNDLIIEGNTIAPTEYGIRVARFKAAYTPTVTIKNNRIDMSSAKSASYAGVYIGYILGDKVSPLLFVNQNVKAGGTPNNWFYLVSSKVTPAEGSDIETPFID